jgi:hypothetical protein
VVPPWTPGNIRSRTLVQPGAGGKGVNVALRCRLSHPAQPALSLGGELGQLCHWKAWSKTASEPLVTWTQSPDARDPDASTEDTADQTAFDPNPTILPCEPRRVRGETVRCFCGGRRVVRHEWIITLPCDR